MRRNAGSRLLGVALVAASNCGDGGSGPGSFGLPSDGGPSDSRPARSFDVEVTWWPCPFYTSGAGSEAECADVDVPADWSDPDGPTIRLFVKHLGDGEGKGPRLWTLMGGPGGSGASYESFARTLLDADPSLQFYLLDHRGTGRSTRLGCLSEESDASPGGYLIEESEWPSCIEAAVARWGDGLRHFTTTNAAKDLGHLIEATREPNRPVIVHGGSYGTFWAHRYLQIFPDQADGVSMIGVVHPEFSFTRYDQGYDTVGRLFLDACADDSFCASKMGSDPAATFQRVLEDFEGGHCAAARLTGLDRERILRFNGGILLGTWAERAVIPALVYRLDRCDPDDVAALQHFGANVGDPLAGIQYDPLYSRVLGTHVALSELWEEPIPTIEELEALQDGTFFSVGSSIRLRRLQDLWPTYEEDEYADRFAATDVPMLMINGTLDPASTHVEALAVGDHFNGPNQHFLELPDGSHGWASPTSQGFGCALNVFYNFILDPEADLLDCQGDILPMDFRGNASMAATYFGTVDLWD